MKNRLIRAAALLCMLTLLLPACALGSSYMYVKTANGKSLNMREDYSTSAEIMTFIPYGAKVEVIEFLESDYWAYVRYNGYYGYCMTRYLSWDKPSSSGGGSGSSSSGSSESFKSFQRVHYVAYVNPSTPSGYVNMRWMPSKTAAVEAVYHAGDTLLVLAETRSWCQVYDEEQGVCGFMMRNFLSQK